MKTILIAILALVCALNSCVCAENEFSPVGVWDCDFTKQYYDAEEGCYMSMNKPENAECIMTFSEDGILTVHYDSHSIYELIYGVQDVMYAWSISDGQLNMDDFVYEYDVISDTELILNNPEETFFCRRLDSGSTLPVITFGEFEQDGNSGNGPEPIEWYVIGEKDGGTILLSKYALYAMRYDEPDPELMWEHCEAGQWLNSSFYETAFNIDEREKLLNWNDLSWKVSLLSEELYDNLTTDKSTLYVIPTTYAKEVLEAADAEEEHKYTGAWLTTVFITSMDRNVYCISNYTAKKLYNCDAVMYIRPVIMLGSDTLFESTT